VCSLRWLQVVQHIVRSLLKSAGPLWCGSCVTVNLVELVPGEQISDSQRRGS